jgi:hypothetical protein
MRTALTIGLLAASAYAALPLASSTKATSTSASIILAASKPKCTVRPAPRVVFDPPLMRLADTSYGVFTVKLSSQPSKPVTCYFDNAALLVNTCSVVFDKTNWNTPQTIRAVTPVLIGRSKPVTLDVTYGMTCVGIAAPRVSLPVNRAAIFSPSGNSAGDPHVTTLAGQYYTWFANGVYWMWKSEHLEIQTITERCAPHNGATCHKAFAIRYGAGLYYFDGRNVNMATGAYSITVSKVGNENGMYYSRSGNLFYLYLPDGSYITIHFSGFSRNFNVYADINMYLSHRYLSAPNAGGLFNKPSATGNDLFAPDGKIYSSRNQASIDAFAATWLVPKHNDFFNRQIKVNSLPDGIAYLSCSGVTSPKTAPTTDAPAYNSYWVLGAQNVGLPVYVKRSETVMADTTEDCKSLFSKDLNECKTLLDTKPYVQKCILDGLITGKSTTFGQSHLENYLIDCEALATSRKSSGNPKLVAQAMKIAKALGQGTFDCKTNKDGLECSGNGLCMATGCQCSAGFFGVGKNIISILDCHASNILKI